MQSKNKPKQTIAEREWVGRIKSMPCICCVMLCRQALDESDAHEIRQGSWFLSIPLCKDCHQGKSGVHGDRTYLRILKCDEFDLLNETLRRMV